MKREYKYILDENKNPVPCADTLEWGKFQEDINNRRVAITHLSNGLHVSTVFLGIDHAIYGYDDEPVLFETMAFRGNHALDETTERYRTWAEAEKGHNDVVAQLERKSNGCNGQ